MYVARGGKQAHDIAMWNVDHPRDAALYGNQPTRRRTKLWRHKFRGKFENDQFSGGERR